VVLKEDKIINGTKNVVSNTINSDKASILTAKCIPRDSTHEQFKRRLELSGLCLYWNNATNDTINSTADNPKARVLLVFPFEKKTRKAAMSGIIINKPTNIYSFYYLIIL
jgi:hypothetical protein